MVGKTVLSFGAYIIRKSENDVLVLSIFALTWRAGYPGIPISNIMSALP
jgi:hypothetical protein